MPNDPPRSSAHALPDAATLAPKIARALARRQRSAIGGAGRIAAVLVPVFDRDGQPHIILTKRTPTLQDHPGQVSLPGGRRDPTDADARATALRESREELGLDPHAVEIAGELDDVATFQSEYVITPVVGIVRARPALRPNPDEIDRVMEVALGEILAIDEALPARPTLRELRYPLDGEDVWGATARILHEFAAVVRTALADEHD